MYFLPNMQEKPSFFHLTLDIYHFFLFFVCMKSKKVLPLHRFFGK